MTGNLVTRLRRIRDVLGSFRRDIRLFLVYNLFSNVGIGAFVLIFNLYLIQNGFDEAFIGAYNALSTLALAAVALGMGQLIGRFGGWTCITYGTILFIGLSIVLSFMTNGVTILAVGMLAGGATAFLVTPIMPFILEWERPQHRATVTALAFSINSLSLTLGSFIGGWSPRMFANLFGTVIESVFTFRLTLILGLAVASIGLIPMWRMREARARSGEEEGEFAALMEMPATRLQVRRDIMAFAGATGLFAVGIGAVMPFYNVYLNSIGFLPSRIGMIFALAGLVAAAIGLSAPMLSNRIGPLNSLLCTRLAAVPFFLVLALYPHMAIAVVAHVVRTTGTGMSWPIDSTFVGEMIPPRVRATAFSIRSGAWYIGYAVASLAAGWIIVFFGYGATFVAFAACSLASTLLFVMYFRGRDVSTTVL
jgi:MFS family permease